MKHTRSAAQFLLFSAPATSAGLRRPEIEARIENLTAQKRCRLEDDETLCDAIIQDALERRKIERTK